MLHLFAGAAILPLMTALALAQSDISQAEIAQFDRESLHAPIDFSAIDAEIDANIERLGLERPAAATPEELRAGFDRLIFPVRARPNADLFRPSFIGNFVDLDPVAPFSRRDWACGTRTYDLNTGYDHAGTDISSGPFRAHAMNRQWVEVVAAAPGVIIARNETAPDRNCEGLGAQQSANYVSILQDDGLTAYYWHLARATVTDRQVGDRVEAGEFLGFVGSSGISTAPHLHFELRHPDIPGFVVDPYDGVCGQGETMWRHQHDYVDPAITAIFTHNFTPENVSDSFCQPEYPRFRTDFSPGDRVYVGLYVRDRAIGALSSLSVRDPSGAIVFTEDFPEATAFAAAGDYQTSYLLPDDAPSGQWVIRAEYGQDVRERAFYVGGSPDAAARLAAALLPNSRSVQAGHAATVFATVLNPSEVAARGCWISPASPFAGRFEYRETDPVSNAVTGDPNALFDIAGGGASSFVLSFTPNAGSDANGYDLLLRYKCDNSDSTAYLSGVNTVLLSFGDQPTPDLVAVALTPSRDGILRLADTDSGNAFAVAVANVGADGELTVRPAGQREAGSLRLRICETDPDTGVCLAAAGDSVTRQFGANESASFAVFARGEGEAVPFAPARNRIRLEAVDAEGVIRGSTSVAVRTD